jgi:para-nitrobenzyl esterase
MTHLVALGLLLAGPGRASAQVAGPVRIAQGLVEGLVLPSGIHAFRGIPFAAPPEGLWRWKAPRPPAAWPAIRGAMHFGPRCMQLPIFSDMVFRSDGMSEDCLYLNVWAPATHRSGRLPVLLYFYGGGFVAGDGSELRYDGESLARHGIIVVTANYRLGVFGFLAHPELTKESPYDGSGNYGLLDQVAALHWVRRNIAAFGGDPHRITIGGESAGSMSVSALMASPLARGLIAGAIGESGALIRPTFPPVPLAEAEHEGAEFARRIGATSLASLRALTADSLLQAANRRFPLTIDGYLLQAAPEEVLAAGHQARVPLLVGWNSQESDWHALLGPAEPTPENYAAALQRLFGDDADAALQVFPGDTPERVMSSATLLAGARFTALGTWKWAELQGRSGQPVYRYLYAHPRPPTKVPAESPPPPGAVHSAEIEYALGNLATNQVYAWTPADDTLSSLMQAYFANFVKTGNPNGVALPRWPAVDSGPTPQIMVLDVSPHAQPAVHEDAYRFLERAFSR